MTAKKHAMTYEEEVTNDIVADYAANMFADGNNRTERDKKVHDAPDYDQAVQVTDPEITNINTQSSLPLDAAESRDGTKASGILDEDGGSLGGTEAELDSLEAGGTPVDRNPRMKG